MRLPVIIATIVFAVFTSTTAHSETENTRYQARKALRSIGFWARGKATGSRKIANLTGLWRGTYTLYPEASTCLMKIPEIKIEHIFAQVGASALLGTDNIGEMMGRSRDKGRMWEFSHTILINGRPTVFLVVYQNFIKGRDVALTGLAIKVSGGCTYVYVAGASRIFGM